MRPSTLLKSLVFLALLPLGVQAGTVIEDNHRCRCLTDEKLRECDPDLTDPFDELIGNRSNAYCVRNDEPANNPDIKLNLIGATCKPKLQVTIDYWQRLIVNGSVLNESRPFNFVRIEVREFDGSATIPDDVGDFAQGRKREGELIKTVTLSSTTMEIASGVLRSSFTTPAPFEYVQKENKKYAFYVDIINKSPVEELIVGARNIEDTRNCVNQPPVPDPGSDKTLCFPSSTVFLTGNVTDDKKPADKLITTWKKINGPGSVIFSSPTYSTMTFTSPVVVHTSATFSQVGVYVLGLEAFDTAISSINYATVTVKAPLTVNATGQAPLVDLAGSFVDLPLGGTVNGVNPPPSGVTVGWSKVAGPATAVTFTPTNAITSVARFTAAGIYTLRLTANDGPCPQFSDVVAKINGRPVVDAEPETQVIHLTDAASITGTVSDDNLPSATISSTWTLVSGPSGGSVSFGDKNALNTTATFTKIGSYTLRLTAGDTRLEASDDIVVHVNGAPLVNAGPDKTLCHPSSITVLTGNITDDRLPINKLIATWTLLEGPGTVTFSTPTVSQTGYNLPFVVKTSATFSETGHYILQLKGDDTDLFTVDKVTVTINAPPVVSTITGGGLYEWSSPRSINMAATVSDDNLPKPPSLTYEWKQISGPANQVVFSAPSAASSNVTFNSTGTFGIQFKADDGASCPTISSTTVVMNKAPVTNAGTDKIICLPNTSVNLSGSVTDDNLPSPPGATSSTWSFVSGPSSVVFGDKNALNTTVTFGPTSGVYTLKLTGGDTHLSTEDTVQVIVNAPPVIQTMSGGGLHEWTGPGTQIAVSVAATDDGLPNPTLTYTWSAQGPGIATFTNPSAAVTNVSFSVSGVYEVQVEVKDGSVCPVTQKITLIMNQAPVAQAGPDKTICLPTMTVTLDGQLTDDRQPFNILSGTWSVVSGPGTVSFSTPSVVALNFSNPLSAKTDATLSEKGTYTLKLEVTDGHLIHSDEVQVEVKEELVVDTGSDQTLLLSSPTVDANLSATVNGSSGFTGTILWTVESGPSPVTIADDASLTTTATFDMVGTYTLRLTVHDGDGKCPYFDEVDIIIEAPINQPPVVNILGPTFVTIDTNQLNLVGTATDDGLIAPLTLDWSQDFGDGLASFVPNGQLTTTVFLDTPGHYDLRLTAFDGEHFGEDTVTVFWDNPVPIVSIVDCPTGIVSSNQVSLTATAIDDGLPQPLAYLWSDFGITGLMSFSPDDDLSTSVTVSEPGFYTVEFRADDGHAFSTAQCIIEFDFGSGGGPTCSGTPQELEVIIEDSVECGGTNGQIQEEEACAIFSPPLPDTDYLITVEVTATIENHNFGYDQVFVNGEPVMESEEGLAGCNMQANRVETVQIIARAGDPITLTYDTVDPSYHQNARAKITDFSFELLNPPGGSAFSAADALRRPQAELILSSSRSFDPTQQKSNDFKLIQGQKSLGNMVVINSPGSDKKKPGDPLPNGAQTVVFNFGGPTPVRARGANPVAFLSRAVASNEIPVLYRLLPSGQWDVVPEQTLGANAIAARITHYGYYQVFATIKDLPFSFSEVFVFPNPVQKGDNATLRVGVGQADSVTGRIYDLAGDLVQEIRVDSAPIVKKDKPAYEHQIDLSALSPGSYVGVVTAEKSDKETIRKNFRFMVLPKR